MYYAYQVIKHIHKNIYPAYFFKPLHKPQDTQ